MENLYYARQDIAFQKYCHSLEDYYKINLELFGDEFRYDFSEPINTNICRIGNNVRSDMTINICNCINNAISEKGGKRVKKSQHKKRKNRNKSRRKLH